MRDAASIAIRVENLSKRYQLGKVGSGSLLRDIEGWMGRGIKGVKRPRGAESGQPRASKHFKMALEDISFELPKGEILGIIGRNGAGKSTLLKLITKITAPSSGRIYINGRISSLLEVGTGFHPELTGRENIFMNGAVLGMGGHEVRKNLEQIIDFSGVREYIDTPVKHYSSGMYTRLAFSVAAFLEPDILILDEVLSVGDAEFALKSMARMKEVNLKEGKTVILVSHNLDSILMTARNCLYLDHGRLKDYGPAQEVVMRYKDELRISSNGFSDYRSAGSPWVELSRLMTMDPDGGAEVPHVKAGDPFRLRLEFNVNHPFKGDVAIFMQSSSYHPILDIRHSDSGRPLSFSKGRNVVDILMDRRLLLHGKYLLSIMVTDPDRKDVYENLQHLPGISVIGTREESGFPSESDPRLANLYMPLEWQHRHLPTIGSVLQPTPR